MTDLYMETAATRPRMDPAVNTLLPAEGPGFYSTKRNDPSHRYGQPETVRALMAIAAEWQRFFPNGPRIGIGDLSLQGGGDTPGHASHEKGVDVDIWLVRTDNKPKPTRWCDPDYSRPGTKRLIDLILANQVLPVELIFFNDPELFGGPIHWWRNHDNHLHVRFVLPSARRAAPGFPPSGAGRTQGVPAPYTNLDFLRSKLGIPHKVVEFLKRGQEAQAVQAAIAGGIRDEKKLIRMIFSARHPERRGEPPYKDECRLASLNQEWAHIRTALVGPVLGAPTGQPPPAPAQGGGLDFLKIIFGIPQFVVNLLQRGQEGLAVRAAISGGLRDENKLANLIFFARHPGRGGKKLVRGEPGFDRLAKEWLEIRDRLVRLALQEPPSSLPGAPAPVPLPRPQTQPGAPSAPVPKVPVKVSDSEVRSTLAMAARTVPGLGITLEEFLLQNKTEAGPIPIEVLLAFIRKEAGTRLFEDATAGKWNEKTGKYTPSFYELGLFQTPAGDHGCVRLGGQKTCRFEPPGNNVERSQFGKGWRRLTGNYPTKDDWKDPVMQLRIGLWDLNSTGERVARMFPALFQSRASEWYLRMAVLYSFSKGAGWTTAFLSNYKNELLALPDSQRWDFLRGKTASRKGFTKVFDPENVDAKMALAAKLRAVRGARNNESPLIYSGKGPDPMADFEDLLSQYEQPGRIDRH